MTANAVRPEAPELSDEAAVEAPTESVSPDRPWRRALMAGLWVWLASRLGLAAVSAIAWIGEGRPNLNLAAVGYKWASQFDSYYFLTIADKGYIRTPDQAYAAFFPVYPMLVRMLTPVFGRDWLAALFVANVALFAVLVLLYRLAEQEFGTAPASRTIFYLVAFPTGFFLTAAYNEGLFIALMLGSVYCMRRGRWWVAGVLGAIAGGTRSAGILLVLPFCYEYLRQHGRRIRFDVLGVALIPLGLVGVMIVSAVTMDDKMAFSNAQSRHWGRQLNWPWVPLFDSFKILVSKSPYTRQFTEIWVHNLLELATVLLILVLTALALVGPWRIRRDQLVFPLFAIALTMFMISFPSTFKGDIPYPLLSTSRIGLEVFPAFMMLGRLGRHPLVDRVLLTCFLGTQGILVARFLHGGWIA